MARYDDAILEEAADTTVCDDLSEFDSQSSKSPPVEELNCDPYLPA